MPVNTTGDTPHLDDIDWFESIELFESIAHNQQPPVCVTLCWRGARVGVDISVRAGNTGNQLPRADNTGNHLPRAVVPATASVEPLPRALNMGNQLPRAAVTAPVSVEPEPALGPRKKRVDASLAVPPVTPRRNKRRGIQGEAEDDARDAENQRSVAAASIPTQLELCVQLLTDARKAPQTLLNPEGRGGCWLMAFMAALWNVLWHDRNVPDKMQPTVSCRILEAFARKMVVKSWNQAIAEEGHGKGGAFAHFVDKYFIPGSDSVNWLSNMHETTTDRVDGGWGGEAALTFLMAALRVERLVLLSTARQNSEFDGISQDGARVGALMTIEFDPFTRKFARMTERVVTMESLAKILETAPFVPVMHFFQKHYYAIVGSKRTNDFMAHALKYHPNTVHYACEVKKLLDKKTDKQLKETFNNLVSDILPCRPFHEWNLSGWQDAAEPAPALQAEAFALPQAELIVEPAAVPEHGPAHSDIIASLRKLATIGRGVEIRLSRISEAGQGLYATRAFDSFEFITEYDGVRNLSKKECTKRRPQTHICQKEGFYVDGFPLAKEHADGKLVTGRGGGTFVNMESPPGMPANATITIQRTPSLLHYNRILIRVLKCCSIASGDEILVDKQSYGTAFSKAVAMGSKRIDPPGAVSNSLPRAAPEDELPAESAPAPAPAVGAPELVALEARSESAPAPAPAVDIPAFLALQTQLWIDFVNETCNQEQKTMFEARMLLNYLSTFDWEATGVKGDEQAYFARIVRLPYDQIKTELLLLRPKFHKLKLHVFRAAVNARLLERVENSRKAAELAVLEERKSAIRRDPQRVAALQLDIVMLQSRFDYRITREFAYEVLCASEAEKDPDWWIGKSGGPIFFFDKNTRTHKVIGVGPSRDLNDCNGLGWKLASATGSSRKAKEITYRRTELMQGVELSPDEVKAVFPVQEAKPPSGSRPGHQPKITDTGFLDISKEGSKGLHWDCVIKLEPLAEPLAVSARGTVPFRTNSKYMRRFCGGRFCLVEALVFATGKSRKELNLSCFTTSLKGEYENRVSTGGISFKQVNACFQVRDGPPFELSHVRQHQDRKRTFDGKLARKAFSEQMNLHSLIRLEHGIFVATVQVDLPSGMTDSHAIVWDAWRRILFLGPGDFNDQVCDGALLVEEADIADKMHTSDVCIGVQRTYTKMTLSDYVYTIFGIRLLTEIKILMVNAHRKGETEHVG